MLFHNRLTRRKRGDSMPPTGTLIQGLEADVDGEPCPPRLVRWLATLPEDLLNVLHVLAADGHGAWLVGGCVRDAMLGSPSTDIDLCTTCTPDRMLTLFDEQAIPTGADFGTITIKGDGRHYEATTLRTESLYRDGRRPDRVVWGTSLREDLSRRDFTFNSMAVDVARQRLYDPYNGSVDLHDRIVRAVGDANLRCEEDALRILRAYRFTRRDDGPLWKMEASLVGAIAQHRGRLNMVAIERRWMEFSKMLVGKRPGELLAAMQNDGVLRFVVDRLNVLNPALFSVLDHPLLRKHSLSQRLAVLFVQHPTKEVVLQLQSLRTSNNLQRRTASFHEHLGHAPEAHTPALRVFSHVLGNEASDHLRTLQVLGEHELHLHTGLVPTKDASAALISKMATVQRPLQPAECLVDGHWIMARTGAVEGIRLGRLKQWLHRIQVEENLTRPDELESVLSRLPFEHGSPDDWPTLSFP